ncbi:MAG: cell division protein FtsA [Proteobacteria bacterium]|nr:cell division protein FtsA [Pseudomonadota bacterium]MDA0861340.1 cell division protein FtsA [Pseudomonadota bacterium]MDA1031095.1 cell division protein FtsA [Pseudomonadota bacterium]
MDWSKNSGKVKSQNTDIIVALDVGTSKIAAVVAEVNDEGQYEVIGLGSSASQGMKKGVVVNIESTVNAIQRALEEAELMADRKIKEVWTGIAGGHIKSFNSHGMVAVQGHEVTQVDIDRVVETARAIPIPTDQQILHVLNQEFAIDGQEDVREPLAMSGMRLEVKVHIVTGAVSAAQNILKCVRRCGLEVGELILQPLASALAVLSEDEKDLGVCLIDIGGGTSDIAIYTQGAIRHTAVIPIAGDQITSDIAMAFRTPTKEAEDIKRRYGCALRGLADSNETIEVPGVGDRPSKKLSRQMLSEVIEPRIEELYALVHAEIKRSGFEELLSSGVVITGGSSAMEGMVDLGEEVLHMPVRLGTPSYVGSLSEVIRNPRYSTSAGLLSAAVSHREKQKVDQMKNGSVKTVVSKMKRWFEANF